jgi:hypothetical protein
MIALFRVLDVQILRYKKTCKIYACISLTVPNTNREIAIPRDVAIVASSMERGSAEQEEKEALKRKVLSYQNVSQNISNVLLN